MTPEWNPGPVPYRDMVPARGWGFLGSFWSWSGYRHVG